MDINKLLLDLEIINQIDVDDKLAVIQEKGETKLSVDYSSYILPIKRWYYGYKRNDTINYLEKMLDNIEKSSNIIINGNHTEIGNLLKYSIHNSLSGFNNLKNTYKNDSIIYSKITLIINKLRNINEMLEKFLSPNLDILEKIENISEFNH